MERQNVTLALPKDVLQRARQIAAVRKTSLSALVTNFLVEYLEREESYEAARRRAMVAMERGLPFNTDGKITWTRDELHERK